MTTIAIDSKGLPIKYAWPGGYPVYYFVRDGMRNDETGQLELSDHDKGEYVCCANCAAKVREADMVLSAQEVNWETSDLYCEYCNERIESAYAEDEAEKGAVQS